MVTAAGDEPFLDEASGPRGHGLVHRDGFALVELGDDAEGVRARCCSRRYLAAVHRERGRRDAPRLEELEYAMFLGAQDLGG